MMFCMVIGFSSGNLLKENSFPIKVAADNFSAMDCGAVELHFPESGLDGFDISSLGEFRKFPFLSVHAQDLSSREKLERMLGFLAEIHRSFKLDNVTIHPDEIWNWGLLRSYDLPFGIENMDWRKGSGKDIADLRKLLALDDRFKMVLDLNHCYSIDKSMDNAKLLYGEFKDRIAAVHISGFAKLHDPLYLTKQEEIITAVPLDAIPVIIESFGDAYRNMDDARRELDYIKKCL